MPSPEAIHQALSEHGSCMQRYNQAAAINQAYSNQPPVAADGGACLGICLDWLRRAVRKSKTSYDGKATKLQRAIAVQDAYDNEAPGREQGRYQSAVTAIQTDQDSEIAALQKKVRDAYAKGQESYAEWSIVMQTAPSPAQRAAAQTEMNQIEERLQKIQAIGNPGSPQARQILDRAEQRVRQTTAARAAQSPLAKIWGDLAHAVEEKPIHAKKGFGQLDVVVSIPKGDYSGGDAVARQILQTEAFGAGRGAIVAFEGSPGHSVALHRGNTSNVVLFDPNVGMYQFTTQAFPRALASLVSTGYPELAGGGVRASFTIFGSGPSGPTVSPPGV